jgi:hypothetical protein
LDFALNQSQTSCGESTGVAAAVRSLWGRKIEKFLRAFSPVQVETSGRDQTIQESQNQTVIELSESFSQKLPRELFRAFRFSNRFPRSSTHQCRCRRSITRRDCSHDVLIVEKFLLFSIAQEPHAANPRQAVSEQRRLNKDSTKKKEKLSSGFARRSEK